MQITDFPLELLAAFTETLDTNSCRIFINTSRATSQVARCATQHLLLRNPTLVTAMFKRHAELPPSFDDDIEAISNRLTELTLDTPLCNGTRLEALVLHCTRLEKVWLRNASQLPNSAFTSLAGRNITELYIKNHPAVNGNTLNTLSQLSLTLLHLEELPMVMDDEWLDRVLLISSQLQKLSLSHLPAITDASLKKVTDLKKLEILYCDCADVVGTVYPHIARMKSLTSLTVFTQDSLTQELIEPLRDHPKLSELNLKYSITLNTIAAPATIRTLKVLDISFCVSLVDANFEPLRNHPTLTTIIATRCLGVASIACSVFASMTCLKELCLESCLELKDEHLIPFWDHKALQVINVSKTEINGSSLMYFAAIETLQELIVEQCLSITKASFDLFRHHPSLRKVSLENTPITGDLIAPLADSYNLKVLNISGNLGLTDAHLACFRDHQTLEELIVKATIINGTCLKDLATLPALHSLCLDDNFNIISGAFHSLRNHPSLAIISVIGCRILSGKEVKSLLSCRHFKMVIMSGDHVRSLCSRYPKRLVLL